MTVAIQDLTLSRIAIAGEPYPVSYKVSLTVLSYGEGPVYETITELGGFSPYVLNADTAFRFGGVNKQNLVTVFGRHKGLDVQKTVQAIEYHIGEFLVSAIKYLDLNIRILEYVKYRTATQGELAALNTFEELITQTCQIPEDLEVGSEEWYKAVCEFLGVGHKSLYIDN